MILKKQLLWLLLFLSSVFYTQAQSTTTDFAWSRKEFQSPQSKTVLVTAHRGAHNDFPENSIAGFKRAIELGVDVIELDVRQTKDGVSILMHDRRVDRTTNGKGPVDSLTFDEIRKLRLKHNGAVTEHQVPTLEEALTLAREKVLVDLDMKTRNVDAVLQAIKKTKTEKTVIFFVYSPDHINMVKKMNSDFLTLVRTQRVSQIDSVFARAKTEAVHIDPSQYTPQATQKIKNSNARVWINTLGEVDKKAVASGTGAYEEFLKNGANIIQTDYPQLLLEFLRKKGLHR